MQRRLLFPTLFLALAALHAAGSGSVRADKRTGHPPAADQALSPEQIRALIGRVITNQHRDDTALEQYERAERRQVRKNQDDAVPAEDKTFRVVPTGTGIFRVQTEDYGRAVDAEVYRRQLRELEQVLEAALHPGASKQRQRVEKPANARASAQGWSTPWATPSPPCGVAVRSITAVRW